MRRAISSLHKGLLLVKRYFAHSQSDVERKNIGLGHFVLLLTLTPFIFSLTLYDFGSTQSVASRYLINPDRFDKLSYRELGTPPIELKEGLREEIELLGETPEGLCGLKSRASIKRQNLWWRANELNKRQSYRVFRKQCDVFNKTDFFEIERSKPAPPEVDIVERSRSQFMFFKERAAISNDSAQSSNTTIEPESLDEVSEQDSSSGTLLIHQIGTASAFQLITYPLWILAFLLIFPMLAICIKRRAWGLAVFGLSVATINYICHVLNLVFDTRLLTALHSPIFAQIAFAWFLIRGQLLSKAFVIFILLLIVSTLLPLLFSGYALIDSSYVSHEGYSVTKAQLPIVIFLVVAAMGRLLVMGAKENTLLLKSLGFAKTIKLAAHAFILWLPMAMLCLPFFYLTEILLPRDITNELHERKLLQFDYSHEKGFLDNALQSTAHLSDDANFAWALVIEERREALRTANKSLQKMNFSSSFSKHYDEVIPEKLEFEEPSSGVPLVGWAVDLATEETQESINDSYVNIREGVEKKLTDLLDERQTQIKDFGDDKKNEIELELDKLKAEGKATILASNTSTQSTIWWAIKYLNAAHQLALLMFAFVCFKSFMYVFARVSFNQETGTVVTLGDSGSNDELDTDSTIRATGLEYALDSSQEETYYITRKYQCRGKPPNLRVPQAFHAPFARLFNKAYTMNKVVLSADDHNVNCTATKGVEFFEWQLADNEKVVFDFHNFVGMTEELTISTLISPRISSLLLGKMIYSQATGPGKLILMAKGRAEICDTSIKVGSLPPERMIAMLLDTKLHIASELDILNIYLSTAHIQPISGKMIVDVDSQRGSKVGLGSFVKHFLFPG